MAHDQVIWVIIQSSIRNFFSGAAMNQALSMFTPKISLRTAEQFCSRFATALKAGIDPLRLLDHESRANSKRHQAAAAAVRERLIAGDTLAEAMQYRSDYFPKLLTQMVEAGEQAGGLDQTFAYMSRYYRDLRETRGSFIKQITWPAIQCFIAIGVVSLLILFVGILFEDSGYDPLGFGLSGVSGVLTFWGYLAIIAAVIALIVRAVWKNWFGLHSMLMPVAVNIPVIGPVLKYLALSRLTTVLSLLLNAGVDAIRSVQMAFSSTGNDYYVRKSDIAVQSVKSNRTLAESFAATEVMPRDFIEAVEVGELSGNETESLDALATEYDRRAKTALTILSTTASVVIWIAIAAFIIFLIFRMFLNYLNILNNQMSFIGV
jgi:type IV pilus assembly protein PilC